MRKLINGKEAEEFSTATDLTIHTKCPSKWILMDLETGQVYRGLRDPGPYGKWERLDEELKDYGIK